MYKRQDIKNISQSLPSKRILEDWKKTEDSLDTRLHNIVNKYDLKIQELCKKLEDITVKPITFFDETDDELLTASDAFVRSCNDVLKAIEILKWGNINFESVKEQLQELLTSSEETSLLTVLRPASKVATVQKVI